MLVGTIAGKGQLNGSIHYNESEYKDGYKQGMIEGQQSVSKFGIQNEVNGTSLVTLDYVNENEHNVEVKLSSDTVTDFSGREVKCIGKNFLDMNIINKDFGLGTPISFPHTVPANNMFVWTEPHIYVTKGQTYYTGYAIDGVFGNQTHYVNYGKASSSGCTKIDNGVFVAQETGWIALRLDVANDGLDGSVEHTVDKLYFGLVPTDIYEPYTEKTYTANADGTLDIPSISPTMNIICDGVDISAKYYCCPSVEYDRLWDNYQDYGQRVNYEYAFYGVGWTDKTLKPKYKITPTIARTMCSNSLITKVSTDIFDFSKTTTLHNTFEMASNLIEVVVNDMSLVTIANNLFYYSSKIQKINLGGINPSCSFGNAFYLCISLVDFKCSGNFGKSVSFQWSSLLKVESAKNIIRCLANLIDTNPFANTISFHANVWTLLDAEGNTSPNGNAWKEYIVDIGWNWN